VDLLAQRLRNQHISGAKLARPEDVVGALCAVQSQDHLGAKWSVGQRVSGATDASVESAFAEGRFLRTHVLRPTWHYVLPADIRWLLALTAPHVLALSAYMHRREELDDRVFARAHKIFRRVLRDGNHLTRAELARALEEGGIVAAKERLAYIMMHAELSAVVCSGAMQGKQHTYALLDERAPAAPPMSRDEALAELARRFFTGHAPATLKHFAWWSGLSVADAKRGLAGARADLPDAVMHEGVEWFGLETRAPRKGALAAYLVPEYDEALTGSSDFGPVDLPPAKGKARWTDTFIRLVLVGSKRAGTWRRTFTSAGALVEVNLFASLAPEQQRALRKAVERYGRYLEMPIELRTL
jgi:hypothetical protein